MNPARGRTMRNLAWVAIAVLGVGAFTFITLNRDRSAHGDPGELSEPEFALPSGVASAALTEATTSWGLDTALAPGIALNQTAGGMALDDLDGDGDLDLVVAHGSVAIYLWEGQRYLPANTLDIERAMAVTTADVDADGWLDLLIARDTDTDTVVWGGPWIINGAPAPQRLDLAGSAPSANLLAGELSGDDLIDIVQLGRGNDRGEPDVLWTADADDPRSFTPNNLGNDSRLSLAGELADIDLDGLLDIWVTRDVGWDTGGDSLYSRQGDPTGEWVDIAAEFGSDLEIDGMGLTLADLDGDLQLDAYVSDLGDNEVLLRTADGFATTTGTGAARIRPPGSPANVVSSSWATGAIDINLDGRLDLVVANGGFPDGGMRNKIPDTEVLVNDPPSVLLGIGDGRFTDVWPTLGLDWDAPARGLTIGDVDGDGDDDIVFLAVDGSLHAYRNDTTGLTVSVRAAAGCDATGAVVTITGPAADFSYQSLLSPHTYGGAHSPTAAVGATNGTTQVRVAWIDGAQFDAKVGISRQQSAGWITVDATC